MTPAPDNKWTLLIEQIRATEGVEQKLDMLATMVFMLATNDLSCMEAKFAGLQRRVVLIGIALGMLILSGMDIKSFIGFIAGLVK